MIVSDSLRRQVVFVVVSLMIVLATAQSVAAQITAATISGTVKDETGGVLPGVNVEVKNLGIQFSGIPSGHEFSTLINDILIVSKRESELDAKTREFLKNLDKPLHLQVFVTPT